MKREKRRRSEYEDEEENLSATKRPCIRFTADERKSIYHKRFVELKSISEIASAHSRSYHSTYHLLKAMRANGSPVVRTSNGRPPKLSNDDWRLILLWIYINEETTPEDWIGHIKENCNVEVSRTTCYRMIRGVSPILRAVYILISKLLFKNDGVIRGRSAWVSQILPLSHMLSFGVFFELTHFVYAKKKNCVYLMAICPFYGIIQSYLFEKPKLTPADMKFFLEKTEKNPICELLRRNSGSNYLMLFGDATTMFSEAKASLEAKNNYVSLIPEGSSHLNPAFHVMLRVLYNAWLYFPNIESTEHLSKALENSESSIESSKFMECLELSRSYWKESLEGMEFGDLGRLKVFVDELSVFSGGRRMDSHFQKHRG